MTVSFTVPGEAVGKGRPRFVRATGRTYTPAKTASYETLIKYAAAEAMSGRPLLDGAIELCLTAVYTVPESWSRKKREGARWRTSKPDADNLAKTADALNGIVWKDDALVARLIVEKIYGPKAELRVRITPL